MSRTDGFRVHVTYSVFRYIGSDDASQTKRVVCYETEVTKTIS